MSILSSARLLLRRGLSGQQLSNKRPWLSQFNDKPSARYFFTLRCTHETAAPALRCLIRPFSTNPTISNKSPATSDDNAPNPSTTPSSSNSSSALPVSPLQEPHSILKDIREYAANANQGIASRHDHGLIPLSEAKPFPRIKTTSLSTKRIVISDEALQSPVTLVLVAFRSIADDQLKPWRDAFVSAAGTDGRWFDVTVNESFAAQALSGFVQRWQRGRTDPHLHDFYVAFNNYAREPLEVLLLSTNRMYGNVLLLDRHARVRFRASGTPTPSGIDTLSTCAHQLIKDH